MNQLRQHRQAFKKGQRFVPAVTLNPKARTSPLLSCPLGGHEALDGTLRALTFECWLFFCFLLSLGIQQVVLTDGIGLRQLE